MGPLTSERPSARASLAADGACVPPLSQAAALGAMRGVGRASRQAVGAGGGVGGL